MDILNVTEKVFVDNSIISSELHTYQPYITSKFEYNDEIRIPIQELDTYTLPSESFLYIEGKLTKEDGQKATKLKFINNGVCFLFREIRYELNGVTVDSNRNVGLTSTIKGYLSYNTNDSLKLQNAGWFPKSGEGINLSDKGGFNVCIPLKMIMGFFEDYKKIMLGMKQELVLIRASSDIDCVISEDESEKPKIEFEKLYWKVPHIIVDIPQQLALTKIIEKNIEIAIAFRQWELVEYASLPTTTRHTWPVKTASTLESPSHISVVLSKDKRGKLKEDMSKFEHFSLTNVRVFLNSERYPYNDLYLNFDENQFALMYEMFVKFRPSYYFEKSTEPVFTPAEFKTICPIAYIDCSHQKMNVQSGSVVIRVEFETTKETEKHSSAFCLILHDKLFSYSPLTKMVRQI